LSSSGKWKLTFKLSPKRVCAVIIPVKLG
jgi:hypothetical protein